MILLLSGMYIVGYLGICGKVHDNVDLGGGYRDVGMGCQRILGIRDLIWSEKGFWLFLLIIEYLLMDKMILKNRKASPHLYQLFS